MSIKAERKPIAQIEHKYGENVFILDDLVSLSLLARLCRIETVQPTVNGLVEILYRNLVSAACNQELSRKKVTLPTRMTSMHPDQHYTGTVIDPDQRAVTVALARAGILPSHVCFGMLNELLTPNQVRQDHVWAARMTDHQERVTGADLGGTKIGGDVEDTTVFIPDPMGATGGTINSLVSLYKKKVKGPARGYVALHLIVTPEYIRAVKREHADVRIYALRLDRGLSPSDVLASVPGTHWDKERGLNEKHYIVPGAGGLGEVLNNSFV
jgi:uracil phosphoribosyltransferase